MRSLGAMLGVATAPVAAKAVDLGSVKYAMGGLVPNIRAETEARAGFADVARNTAFGRVRSRTRTDLLDLDIQGMRSLSPLAKVRMQGRRDDIRDSTLARALRDAIAGKN